MYIYIVTIALYFNSFFYLSLSLSLKASMTRPCKPPLAFSTFSTGFPSFLFVSPLRSHPHSRSISLSLSFNLAFFILFAPSSAIAKPKWPQPSAIAVVHDHHSISLFLHSLHSHYSIFSLFGLWVWGFRFGLIIKIWCCLHVLGLDFDFKCI